MLGCESNKVWLKSSRFVGFELCLREQNDFQEREPKMQACHQLVENIRRREGSKKWFNIYILDRTDTRF
jgi:hypothetical protein